MTITYKTYPHPDSDIKRNLTVIFVNNKLDIPSTEFLLNEVRHGGRCGGVAAESVHRDKAIKIGEMYRHLHSIGKDWRSAFEIDFIRIRNAMLCWDANDNKAYDDYEYKHISNNAMNSKINIWYKFYKYMENIDEPFDLVMTTKKVKVKKRHGGVLKHLDDEYEIIEIWTIKVKPDPEKYVYHALPRFDYHHFEKELEKIDIVYAMIAHFMVETGLRIKPTVKVREDSFRNYLIDINKGKSIDEKRSHLQDNFRKMSYVAKGGLVKNCDLPIRTIINIKEKYLSRVYPIRKKLHSDKYSDRPEKLDENAMWILENGRIVNEGDIRRAFKQASEVIGYTVEVITPHWLRHTFATWILIDYFQKMEIPFTGTGVTPDVMAMGILAEKLGQVNPETALIYTRTAFKMMVGMTSKGPIMSFRNFSKDKRAQEIVECLARDEFGKDFDTEIFDVFKYAESKGIVVDY
ncbi:site-specific integrase [Sulfurovum sp. XGS-02]|uniref:site-specific integrase n=1 Tax=Sulfurovum sp. XGS-02 TaxID=2925411 RepID=UPI002059104D|nr:site-specific integrase [Sulfurovum sp. XGS-02]UPT78167.1 site-specific integrase [Sulfurovum sp. XGS-02]